eukprot:CAMPEP_0181412632 /NCGR_PEP_ID=MMETSP1110-20121109/8529_1 /TAXON_ID=174948 /ORGANISM="Symbiodinium sp., Strain CCMP421" /LENGTH=48 /DNA_ID= /DNA_START= /DNA_END= /DNA_ORIENTATION=
MTGDVAGMCKAAAMRISVVGKRQHVLAALPGFEGVAEDIGKANSAWLQ